MTIRDARVEDVPAVLPMVRRMYELHTPWDPVKFALAQDPAESYGPWLAERVGDDRSAFLVAEAAGGAVCGFVIGTVEMDLPIYRHREHAFIHDLWVDEACRGAGVGRRLLEGAIARFAARGVTQVRLETAAPNEGARRLFRSMGFHEASVLMLRQG